ncbi:MAG TPA: indole-3-glycerol phosphate synthase TrpC, partial [Thermodesulfobacteriota bacterium]|nr:indole-3-glycerol phosphate synthase TrpC [Thermodesulfobacteriota bacterium]
MKMFLQKMAAIQREEISRKKTRSKMDELRGRAENSPPPRDFKEKILRNDSLALIAEIKKASPSAGVIRGRADVRKMGREYQRAGACAISVLTEPHFFHGELSDVMMVKETVDLPILQKDFVVDSFQVYEGRVAGADAILLIAAILKEGELGEFVELARSLSLYPLVEVHDEIDLKKISGLDLPLIGINNRNLWTLEVDLNTTERLIKRTPPEMKVISESG